MTLRVVSPAPVADMLMLFAAAGGVVPRLRMQVAVLQAARAETFGVVAGDVLLAAVMLYPLPAERAGERLVEAAFVCRPGLDRRLLPFVRIAHRTRYRLADTGRLRVRAHVRIGHRPGQRLAQLCGLRLVGEQRGLERWEVEGRE